MSFVVVVSFTLVLVVTIPLRSFAVVESAEIGDHVFITIAGMV